MMAQAAVRTPQPVWLHVKCPCGRDLRARPEQAGSSITCWSCHAAVPVPVPVAPGGWVARLLRMAARQVLDAQVVTLLSIGALLVTVAVSLTSLGLSPERLGLPQALDPGVWAAAVALGLVMAGYGELLRRGSQGDWTPRPRVGWIALAWRALICLATGTALVLPLLIASIRQTPPRVTPAGLAIAGAALVVLPLVMLATYLPAGSPVRRVRVVGSMLVRHPLAVLASLLVLPAALACIEAGLILVAQIMSTFGFLVVDLFPPRESITIFLYQPYYMPSSRPETWFAIEDADSATLFGLYGQTLRQGYTLVGAIPASLALGKTTGYNLYQIRATPGLYVTYRMGYTLLIVAGMLSALAVQARWLGLLAMVDTRRSSASVGDRG